jgi:heme a synthase
MKLSMVQKISFFCLLSVVALIFMGAIVRATNAGMGCPDWPTCWGKLIPPTSKEQIDVSKLDLEKYKKKREKMGGNPNDITLETVVDQFNAVHTWTEYTNRLLAMPIGFGSLLLVAYTQLRLRKARPFLWIGSIAVLFLVLTNAVMGARVVYSGLSPGVITIHMALAILLLCLLVVLIWSGGEERHRLEFSGNQKLALSVGWVLFALIVIEGIMGSQVRELTDELKRHSYHAPRSEWTKQLEESWVYVMHRSFSWLILFGSLWFAWFNFKFTVRKFTWIEICVVGTVFAQMCLGLILSKVGVLALVQVLHIGLSSILVSSLLWWLLTAFPSERKLR